MKDTSPKPELLKKIPTGIEGLDEITGGGLPVGRATLLIGGPGCGKTILALQTLVNGARSRGDAGIFVAFEESAARITANAASFGWDLPGLQRKKLFFLDAQPAADLQPTGSFDLQGLLALLDVKVRSLKAKYIVFDSVDVLLNTLDNPAAERREVHRLHEWLLERGLTALITAKEGTGKDTYGFMQFMVDCAVSLSHTFSSDVSQRSICILKYRGSAFAENKAPLVIDSGGLMVGASHGVTVPTKVSKERVSTGIEPLDAMLGGGYHRGSSVLITGSPGTAKTTLSGAFAEAACARGERTLYISFDSAPAEIVRNLSSVHIRLERFVRSGLLKLHVKQGTMNNAEVHLLRIQALISTHQARCLVIDPISALDKQGNEQTAHGVVERLINWAKARGITVVCTSLLARDSQAEATDLQISTIADTWIHLSYLVQAGERNRALTIIKSRGTAHSNQVRELVLSNQGISLTEVSTVDGQVLMGTQRWQQEQAELTEQLRMETEVKHKQVELENTRSELRSRVQNLSRELELKEAELNLLEQTESLRKTRRDTSREALLKLRGGVAKKGQRGR